MVQIGMEVERQIKRRGSTRFQTNSTYSSSTWRPNKIREGVAQPKPFVPTKVKLPKAKVETFMGIKGKFHS